MEVEGQTAAVEGNFGIAVAGCNIEAVGCPNKIGKESEDDYH